MSHLDCASCCAPLFAPTGRGVIDDEHDIACECGECDFWFEETAPKQCDCGAVCRVIVDESSQTVDVVIVGDVKGGE